MATEIRLSGHLTADALDAELARIAPALAGAQPASVTLLVDAGEMTGYHVAARERFVAWNRMHRDRVRRVAIVTTRTLWRAVISAMALASSQQIRAFADAAEARDWLAR